MMESPASGSREAAGGLFTNESYNKGLDLQLSKISASVVVWEVTVFFHRGFYFYK